jgi:hypothetical protein
MRVILKSPGLSAVCVQGCFWKATIASGEKTMEISWGHTPDLKRSRYLNNNYSMRVFFGRRKTIIRLTKLKHTTKTIKTIIII